MIGQTACQNRPLATVILVKPTSPLAQRAHAFLVQSHVSCCFYLTSLSHSSVFSWSDYSLHFQLMPQSWTRCGMGGGGADFQIVLEMWTDFKWSEQVGCLENRQRCCRPQLCRSTSGSPPCARGVSLRRAALPASLHQKQQRTRELSENREIVGWQGLNCSAEQLFLTELPVLSALKGVDYFVILPQSHTDILYSEGLSIWFCWNVKTG